jgi:hypothetical protein
MTRFWIFLLLVLFTLASCTKKPSKSSDISKQLTVEQIDFDYFSAKSKLDFKTPQQSAKVTLNIRMKKDSIVWMSVRKLSFEGLRVLITKDSAFIINRLEKTYFACDINALSEKINFEVNLGMIQAMILGNILPIESEYAAPVKKKEQFMVAQDAELFLIKNYISRITNKLSEVKAVKKGTDEKLHITYDNFKTVGQYLFPHKAKSSIDFIFKEKEEHNEFEIEHSKVLISNEKLSFPFSRPSKYTQKSCDKTEE